jgi:four helix bundle protein
MMIAAADRILHRADGMTPKELKARTKRFSDRIVAFCTPLLDHPHTRDHARQLLRSGTGLNSNYGSAQVARSPVEFAAKVGQVLDDANESLGWLRLLRDSALVKIDASLDWLLKECDELARIFGASFRTARANAARRQAERKRKNSRRISDR